MYMNDPFAKLKCIRLRILSSHTWNISRLKKQLTFPTPVHDRVTSLRKERRNSILMTVLLIDWNFALNKQKHYDQADVFNKLFLDTLWVNMHQLNA